MSEPRSGLLSRGPLAQLVQQLSHVGVLEQGDLLGDCDVQLLHILRDAAGLVDIVPPEELVLAVRFVLEYSIYICIIYAFIYIYILYTYYTMYTYTMCYIPCYMK